MRPAFLVGGTLLVVAILTAWSSLGTLIVAGGLLAAAVLARRRL